MFYRLKNFINGVNRVRIEGLNLDRLLNGLPAKGIVMSDISRPTHRVLECVLSDKMLSKLIVSLDPLCYNITIIYSRGVRQVIKNAKKRWGLVIGLALVIVGVAVYNTFVWNVQVLGADNIPIKEINGLLKQGGVFVGAPKRRIDRRAAADMLSSNLQDASLVTIELRGTSAIVHIKERILPPQGSDDDGYGYDIIADADCIVDSVTALSGTPLVKAGDIVKRGDVLIAGYEERYEGSTLLKDMVKADGLVWGETNYTYTKFFALERVEYARTGKHKTVTVSKIFGKEFGKSGYVPPYAFYETETDSQPVMYMLPVRMTVTRYYELKARLVVLNPEETVPLYSRQLLQEAMLKVPSASVIKNSYTTVTQNDNVIKIDAIVKARQIISTRLKADG